MVTRSGAGSCGVRGSRPELGSVPPLRRLRVLECRVMAAEAPQRRRFLGWDTVAGGAVFQALQAALVFQSFGVYVVEWSAEFGWARATIAGGYALATLPSGLLGPLQGRMLERFGVRRVLTFGLVTLAVGLIGLSQMQAVWMYVVSMAAVGIGVAASGYLSLMTAIVPWFVRRRSTAVALMSMGIGVGGALVPAITAGVVQWGWRTMLLASALAALTAGLSALTLMRRPPATYGQLPDGDGRTRPRSEAARSGGDLNLAQALRTSAFWLLGIGHAAAILVGAALNVHLVSFLTGSLAFGVEAAARVVALITISSAVGQLIGGQLGDRLPIRKVTAAAMALQGIGVLLLTAAVEAGLLVIAFAVLHGFAWGVRGPLMGSIRADYFGARYFGSIMGASLLMITVGELTGPILVGAAADRFGDHRLGFQAIGLLALAAAPAFYFARAPRTKGPEAV
jgi:MFS family permease